MARREFYATTYQTLLTETPVGGQFELPCNRAPWFRKIAKALGYRVRLTQHDPLSDPSVTITVLERDVEERGRPKARAVLDWAWRFGRRNTEIDSGDYDAYRVAAKRAGYVIRVEKISDRPGRSRVWLMSKPGTEWKMVAGEWKEVLKAAPQTASEASK